MNLNLKKRSMMNAISFGKGKIALQLLFIVSFQLASTTCQLNLYDTNGRFASNSLQSDCLNYHVYREKLAYQELSDVVDKVISYCFRPANDFDQSFEASVDPLAQKLSFEQMRMANITSQRLLLWSVPTEVAQRYQFYYLNQPNFSMNEYFYNCTPPRFGLRCQYSFEFDKRISFNEIFETTFRERSACSKSSDVMAQIPCYVLLVCHRDGRTWCHDWREVCDRKVDCFDKGLDEESYFDMEINESNEDEYRCHNPLCISQDLWEDDGDDTEYLDRSDTVIKIDYSNSCFQDPTFRCEEHSCKTNVDPFSCGDGQCVLRFDDCHNGRHVLLIDSMTAKGNLTDECWVAMLCLIGLVKKGNESLCDTWLINSSAYAALEQCDSDHITFLYENPRLKSNVDEFLLPDYVCFDQQLRDSIVPDVVDQNLTCLDTSKLELIWNIAMKPWTQLLLAIKVYFGSCLIPHALYYNKTNDNDYPSLYKCQNSLKLISTHRIMAGTTDYYEDDDENYQYSCGLNNRYRVKCQDANKCWSPIMKNYACVFNGLEDSEKIPFRSFYDGIDIYFYDKNRQKRSDEFGCGNWSCHNIYAQCDGFWACSDGRDEGGCGRTICPSQTYACLSPVNYTVICLPPTLVKDRIVHCLGALDEQFECRSTCLSTETSFHFHCRKHYRCLPLSQVCGQDSAHNCTKVEPVLSGPDDDESRRTKYFSVHTSSNYPTLEKSIVAEFIHWPIERRSIRNGNVSRIENNLWPWYYNRGLTVHTWFENNSSDRTCICPSSYCGYLLQYQNQRISLTLRLASDERHATYAVVSILIDDNDETQEIDTYNQFVHIAKQSCTIKLNRYLLFPTRPKNTSKNYSVRIDIYEENAMTYVGSWHFPIAFVFLPVNRLGLSLNLSNHRLERSFNCSNTFFTLSNTSQLIETTILRKLTLFQRIFIFHIAISYQRIIYFHLLCQTYLKLTCFIDQVYLCLCTNDLHANCMEFNRQRNFHCPLDNYCANEGECLQDHPTCPSRKICLCPNCFFGRRCQFYAKGLGSTLDEILGYEFKRHTLLSKQPTTVKLAATITMLLFVIGLINSILSIMTFARKKLQEVSCGIYLLVSSIISLCIMILFTLKFWLLFFSHQNLIGQHDQQRIIIGNCFGSEPILKALLYADNWLNVCVTIERTVSALHGVTFNKKRSRRVAYWTTLVIFLIIIALLFPQVRHLRIFNDKTEERSWCIIEYAPWLQKYSSIMIFFHYFAPLSINILSIVLMVITIARQRTLTQTDHSFWVHLRSKLKQHQHVLMSSALLIYLTLPYLIISIILDCYKSSHSLWFHLTSYFLSFFPATLFLSYLFYYHHFTNENLIN